MYLCKCGCGQEVKPGNIFVNGHNMRGKVAWNRGITHKEEVKRKMSEMKKGKIPWIKGKKHSKETIIKISEANKGQIPWDKGLTKETDDRVKKISKSKKFIIEQYQEKYPTFSKEEEIRYNPDKPGEKEIQVHCKYNDCKNSKENNGWFTPTSIQMHERIRQLENYNGNDGAYFYCSERCKQECCLYYLRTDPNIRKEFEKYNIKIRIETEKTLKKCFDKIKNIELRGKEYNYELDHKFSVYDGFINKVDPKIISNWKNLECIPMLENRQKNKNSSITLEELKKQINEEIK